MVLTKDFSNRENLNTLQRNNTKELTHDSVLWFQYIPIPSKFIDIWGIGHQEHRLLHTRILQVKNMNIIHLVI